MHCLIPTTISVRNQFAREGLAHILVEHDFEIAQSVASLDEIEWAEIEPAHIVIFEGAPTFSTDELAQVEHLIARHPGVRIVLMTNDFDLDLISRAFTAGIYGCMPNDTPVEGVVSLLRLVALGQKVIPKEMSELVSLLSTQVRSGVAHDIAEAYSLSEREFDILKCLMAGMPNKMVSRSLGISEAAVKLHVKVIFRKMSVTNRTQAAILAHELDGVHSHR